MRPGHMESIFHTYWKGEKCVRAEEGVKAVAQNSVTSAESLGHYQISSILTFQSPSFHQRVRPAPGPSAASDAWEFPSCILYVTDANCHQWDSELGCIWNESRLRTVAAIRPEQFSHCDFCKDQYTIYSIPWRLNWKNASFIYMQLNLMLWQNGKEIKKNLKNLTWIESKDTILKKKKKNKNKKGRN